MILSSPSDSPDYKIQADIDCYILDQGLHSRYQHSHLSDKEWIQMQTSLLPPVIQPFSSTFPSDSPPHSPPSSRIGKHIQCDSGI